MSDTWAVEAIDLSVRFGDFTAVDRVSFNVAKGEIFGFLGANGAGKTTTIRVLCGLLLPSDGKVRIAGKDPTVSEKDVKAQVGYMSQKFTLYNDLSVEENLSFIAALRKIDRQTFQRRKQSLLSFIEFDRPLHTLVRDLPGGTKQHVSLAGALLHDPSIIFLDEPTAGVSPSARARFWSLIKRLAQEKKTVFVTTHYMDEAEQCQRIALMRQGQIVGLDSPDGLKWATFRQQIFEFTPKKPLSFASVMGLRKDPCFSYFEPYGLRFHAALAEGWSESRLQERFGSTFNIVAITPSLEDVFIHAVEAQSS